MDTSGRPHRGVLTGEDMARWQAAGRGAAHLPVRPLHRVQARPVGQGPVMLQQLALLKGFALDGLDVTAPEFIQSWSKAPSSPSRTARNSTAIPNSSKCRWRRCFRTPTTRSARKLIHHQASLELRPGSVEGFGAVDRAQARRGRARGGRRHRRRRADRRPESARCAATPCISTSSTAPATWCRRRRRAAGCNPRR